MMMMVVVVVVMIMMIMMIMMMMVVLVPTIMLLLLPMMMMMMMMLVVSCSDDDGDALCMHACHLIYARHACITLAKHWLSLLSLEPSIELLLVFYNAHCGILTTHDYVSQETINGHFLLWLDVISKFFPLITFQALHMESISLNTCPCSAGQQHSKL
jgi:hypothetical protein